MKRNGYLIFSLLVTAGVMGYLLRMVSVEEVIFIIANISFTPLICFLFLSLGHTFFQTWRYLLLLQSIDIKVSGTAMFLITTARNMFSDFLPARIGTLSYVYLLNSRLNVSIEKVLPSFAVSFLFDVIAIIPLLLLSLFSIGWTYFNKFLILIPISLAMLTAFLLLLYFLPAIFKIISKLCLKIPFFNKMAATFVETAGEIEQIKKSGIYLSVFSLSLAVRLCKYAKLYFLLLALLDIWGYGWKEIGFGRFFLGVSGAEFSASLPISGIAAFGAYEGTWAFMFHMLGFPKKLAVLTGISHHLITQAYGYLLGAISLLILLLPGFNTQPIRSCPIAATGRFATRFFFSLAVLVGVLLLVYVGQNSMNASSQRDLDQKENTRNTRHQKKSDPLSGASEQELRARNHLAKTINGKIIYTRKGRVRKIVIGKWQVMDLGSGEYARWGPAGKRIAVFENGTIYVMDAEGHHRKKLVDIRGKVKHNPIEFHTNGKEIIYAKPGQGLWTVKLASGKTHVLEASRAYNGEPGISADGKRLAVRYGHSLYAIDLVTGQRRKYGRGCSAGISPDGKHLMKNIDGHREMVIHNWNGKRKKRISAASCLPDKKWDNHHWSNDNDYLAAQGSGKFQEAYVFRISKNQCTRVTWEGDVRYPDLFIKR